MNDKVHARNIENIEFEHLFMDRKSRFTVCPINVLQNLKNERVPVFNSVFGKKAMKEDKSG